MIIAAALGMVAGILLGLLPGIGATTVMLALIPVLSQTDIIFVFAFYFAMLTTSQYFGSVTAIAYGYPGEISSMPAVTHGHAMMRSGQGAQALAMTSTGSFLAVMIGLGVLVALYHSVAALSVLFQTRYLVPMFLAILVMMILTTPNKILSLIMMQTSRSLLLQSLS
jgi:putative tricarboxylic transport membrane protein